MYVVAYKTWNDGGILVVEKEELKHYVRRMLLEYDPEEIDKEIGCAEVRLGLLVPVVCFNGCVYAREVLEKLGVKFEPLIAFMKKRELWDEELEHIICFKSI